jgi:membrane protein required for beta-lactamase induction
MDWVPVRLVGLAFALVGKFGPTFGLWCNHLLGMHEDQNLVVEYGKIALDAEENEKLPELILGLLERGLLVWLVVLALFSIGYWIG